MKTPKRDYFAFAPLDMYVTPGTANKLSARWKRKNRTARLKAKIARLSMLGASHSTYHHNQAD